MRAAGGFLWLEVRRTVRHPRYLIFTLGFPLMFYLLFTSLYGNARVGGMDFGPAYMVAMAAYGALGAALNSNGPRLAMERAGGWARQLRVTPLAPTAYILAKTAMAVCVALPAMLAVAAAAVLVEHVHLTAGDWLALLLGVWIGVIPFAVLGVLLGYLLDADSAQGGTMVVYFGLSILGGMWFPVQVMPRAMRAVARVLPSYHWVAIGWNALAGRAPGWGNVAVLAAYTAAFAAAAVWRYRRDEAQEYA
jgi:ABC-2 type transport system permease protein